MIIRFIYICVSIIPIEWKYIQHVRNGEEWYIY